MLKLRKMLPFFIDAWGSKKVADIFAPAQKISRSHKALAIRRRGFIIKLLLKLILRVCVRLRTGAREDDGGRLPRKGKQS